jgi:hypothetical protein
MKIIKIIYHLTRVQFSHNHRFLVQDGCKVLLFLFMQRFNVFGINNSALENALRYGIKGVGCNKVETAETNEARDQLDGKAEEEIQNQSFSLA